MQLHQWFISSITCLITNFFLLLYLKVRDVIVSVFDTVAPANALCITRSGLLFCASEFGDHALFQFSGIGDGEGVCTARKCDDPELGDDGASAASVAPTFAPPPLLLTGGGGNSSSSGSGAAASGGEFEEMCLLLFLARAQKCTNSRRVLRAVLFI